MAGSRISNVGFLLTRRTAACMTHEDVHGRLALTEHLNASNFGFFPRHTCIALRSSLQTFDLRTSGDAHSIPQATKNEISGHNLVTMDENKKGLHRCKPLNVWLRGKDLNLRPSGYEPDELPDCSTPRWNWGL